MKTRLALLLPLAALAGCAADNNASVRVSAICSLPSDPTACTFADKCDAQYIGDVAIDVSTAPFLWLVVQVDNLLPDNGNSGSFRTNTNDAFIQSVEVEYSGLGFIATAPVIGSAKVPAAGSAVISVYAVPETAVAAAAVLVPAPGQVDVIAKLRLKGVLADTSTFETGTFDIPVRICNGTGCAGGALPTCTSPDVLYVCPPTSGGQRPLSAGCATP